MGMDLRDRLLDAVGRLTYDRTGGSRGRVLLVVALGWLLILGVRYLVPTLLPQVKQTFGVTNAAVGIAVTLIWGSYALMQFPAGVLVDRVGERILLTLSPIVAAGSLITLGVAPLFAVFLAGCVVFGLGTGLYGPARGTVISNIFTSNAGIAFGVTLAAGSIGSAALPLLSGMLVNTVGWQPLLIAIATPFVFTGVFMYYSVPPVTNDAPTTQMRTIRTQIWAVLHQRAVLVPVIAVALMLFVFQGLSAFLPIYLIEAKGLSQATASMLFAAMFVSAAGSQLVAGAMADRFGHRPVLVTISGVGVLTIGALPFVAGVLPLTALILVLGSRMAVAPVTNEYIIATLPDEIQGTAWGLLRTLLFLFASISSTIVGVLADFGWLNTGWIALAGLTAIATAVYALLPRVSRITV